MTVSDKTLPTDATLPRAANVFVFEQTRQEIDGAATFGAIRYLFRPNVGRNSRSSIWDTDTVAEEIIDALCKGNYDPAIDFICITGNMIPMAILVATVATEYGRFKALLYDAKDKLYVCRELGFAFDDTE